MIMRLLGRKNKFLKTQGKEQFDKSLGHALDGIEYAINNERNIKIEIFIAILTSIFGFIFDISVIEWAVIVLNFGLVLGLEMVNTAIERTVDLVTKDYYELAKNAKDVAAGAVLIASMFSCVIGIIVFLPKFIELIK